MRLAWAPEAPAPRVLVEAEREDGKVELVDPVALAPEAFDWRRQPRAEFPIPPYARFLDGVKIVIDPGHGGRGHRKGWKVGPTGLREAEVNLRVALFLRDFLRSAGAEVLMTRESDRYLHSGEGEDLRRRAALANEARADLLISIHHNAAGNPEANYTAVFYHGEPDESTASLAAARWVLSGLQDALRLERTLESGVQSDHVIHPPPDNDGFAVLRHARVPAILTEASFFTHPAEEQRLRDPLYNRREAYGLFVGLARWAQAGLPRVRLLEPRDGRVGPSSEVVVRLDDGLSGRGGMGARREKILLSSVVVQLNGRPLGSEFDARARKLHLRIPPDAVRRGANTLYVNFRNIFGQPVLHPEIELRG